MKARYSTSNEVIFRETNSDNEEGLDLTLMFEWQLENEGAEEDGAYFSVTYTASSDDDGVSMISGQPRSNSYQELLRAARDTEIKDFDLIIDTVALPQAKLEAMATVEASIHIEFDGPMGFRKFILRIAEEMPPEEDRECPPGLDGRGPSPKDPIN